MSEILKVEKNLGISTKRGKTVENNIIFQKMYSKNNISKDLA